MTAGRAAGALAAVLMVLVAGAACSPDGGGPAADRPSSDRQAVADSAIVRRDEAETLVDPVELALADLRDDSGILDEERHARVYQMAITNAPPIPEREPFLAPHARVTPAGEAILRDDRRPHLFGFDWLTNFGIRIVKLEEFDPRLLRDRIIPLSDPDYISVAEADRIYSDGYPVQHINVNGDVRAFPVAIMLWHEVVNDTVGGVPVLVTYCPLCNTAIAFDRRVGGRTLSFGTSGLLRNSDLVMYDHQTESVWQQVGGKALIGDMVGATLPPIPSGIVSWAQFRDAFPDALVLARPALRNTAGERIPYGVTPYTGYDNLTAAADVRRLFRGEPDERLHFAERVVGLSINGEAVAYPFRVLAGEPVVADVVGGAAVVVVWTPGAVSVLDQIVIEASREVGGAAVFRPTLNGVTLTFEPNPDDPQTFRDVGTGSTWNIFGRAVAGELAGAQLTPIAHGTHLWFAWAVFEPDTTIYGSPVG